jgi:hypothetical protein
MPARSVKKRRKSNKQRGGTKLTDAQFNILSGLGFTDDQKNAFNAIVEQTFNENVTDMLVTAAQNDIHRINPQTGRHFTPQELIDNLRNTVRNAAGVKRRRKSKKMRKYKKSRKTKKQKGGADFSQAQRQELLDLGFTEDHIDTLTQVFPNTDAGVVMNLIQQSLGQINNITGQPNTPQEIIDSFNPDNDDDDDDNISNIGDEDGSENNISVGSFESNDNSENSNMSYQGDTTNEDDSSFMNIEELNLDNANQNAGRRRKTRKGRKGKKTRKQRGLKQRGRKQRGGMRYGTGVGSNCFEPNYSIYNTPALTLFPYKPN